MYTSRPYTKRVWGMREKVRNRVIIADSEMTRIKMEASQRFVLEGKK